LKNALIKWFIKRYQVDLSIAERKSVSDYKSFNDFFTRKLQEGARPFTPSDKNPICPADGAISQFGALQNNQLIQAKGVYYSAEALLADKAQAEQFASGDFMTIYLSPKDYHRVHMPLTGKLVSTTYIPGRIFSVNPLTAEHVPNLFARNERLVCEFETSEGPMMIVLVGAMIVASISTVWAGKVAPANNREIERKSYKEENINLQQGDELGFFSLGSTVILLFPKQCDWAKEVQLGAAVQFGQGLISQ
jgi:phosphatidylserine decarboxylase